MDRFLRIIPKLCWKEGLMRNPKVKRFKDKPDLDRDFDKDEIGKLSKMSTACFNGKAASHLAINLPKEGSGEIAERLLI